MPDHFELPEEDLDHWEDVYYSQSFVPACVLVGCLSDRLCLLPAAIGPEVRIEEDPLVGDVVPHGGEVAVRGPGQGWPGWTSFHTGAGAKLEIPTDQ